MRSRGRSVNFFRLFLVSSSMLMLILALVIDFMILSGYCGFSPIYIEVEGRLVGLSWPVFLEVSAIVLMSIFFATFKKNLFALLFGTLILTGLILEIIVQLAVI